MNEMIHAYQLLRLTMGNLRLMERSQLTSRDLKEWVDGALTT